MQNNENRQRGENHWTHRKKAVAEPAQEPPTASESFTDQHEVQTESVFETSQPEMPVAVEMTEHDRYNAEIARIRKTRKPFGSSTQKLVLPKRSGYHRHWFNDVPGRIDQALASGWMHIEGIDGSPVKRVVGQGRDRGGLIAFAMEIPDVFWEEDMAEQEKLARAPLDAIKGNPVQAKPGQSKPEDNSKFYSPREQILDIQRR